MTDNRITIERDGFAGPRTEFVVTEDVVRRVIRTLGGVNRDDIIIETNDDDQYTIQRWFIDGEIIEQSEPMSLAHAHQLVPQYTADLALDIARRIQDNSGSWHVTPESDGAVTFELGGEPYARVTIERI